MSTRIYDGLKWHTDKHGYYHRDANTSKVAIGGFLHTYVWTKQNGPIPDGYVIHHRDHDRTNNDISNLELMLHGDHDRHHKAGKEFSDTHRANLSKAGMGHKVSPETKAKIKAARARQVFTPETRARMSAAQKRRYAVG